MMVTLLAGGCASLSITRLTCSRKAPRVSYSSIARASSARFSRRPALSARAVGLEHGGVAAFVEHDAGELGVRQLAAICRQRAMSATKRPRLRRACGVQLVAVEHLRGGEQQRLLRARGRGVDGGDRLVAEAALGLVDDAFEGEVVGRLGDQAEVGEGVADLGALVEAEAADDLVGEADGDEALLELAGLELGADEDGAVVERAAAALLPLDLLADAARFLGAVPDADDLDLVALATLGPQGLAEAAGVVGDEAGGGGEDVRGRAVILLEPDDRGAGEVLFEAQDVGDLGAAPANRSTGRRRRRSTGCGAARRAASASHTATGWCPDIRRPGCSGSGRGRLEHVRVARGR